MLYLLLNTSGFDGGTRARTRLSRGTPKATSWNAFFSVGVPAPWDGRPSAMPMSKAVPLRCFGWRDAFDDAVTLGAANNPTTGTSRLCAEPDISNIPLPLALAG